MAAPLCPLPQGERAQQPIPRRRPRAEEALPRTVARRESLLYSRLAKRAADRYFRIPTSALRRGHVAEWLRNGLQIRFAASFLYCSVLSCLELLEEFRLNSLTCLSCTDLCYRVGQQNGSKRSATVRVARLLRIGWKFFGRLYCAAYAQPDRTGDQRRTTASSPPRSSKTLSASNPMTSSITASRRLGRRIASSAPASSASDSRPRHAF
jgi:hypothetical protein